MRKKNGLINAWGRLNMNAKLIGYWISLVLFCAAMGFGGIADLTKNPEIMESLKGLGYPSYLADILGFWKIVGVVALLLPGYGMLKEWAYAGFFFDLTGASASHWIMQDELPKTIIPLVILAIGMVSWYLRPSSRCVTPSAGLDAAQR